MIESVAIFTACYIKKLQIVNTLLNLLFIVKICLQLTPLSQGNLFLMIGSLKATYKLIFTIPMSIQFSSINSIRLKFSFRKTSIRTQKKQTNST